MLSLLNYNVCDYVS